MMNILLLREEAFTSVRARILTKSADLQIMGPCHLDQHCQFYSFLI